MRLPAHRQISMGRTHATRWEPLDYACAIKGWRHPVPVASIARAVVGIAIVALVAALIAKAMS